MVRVGSVYGPDREGGLMPILAGIVTALFFKVFEILAARLTFNIAFSTAIVAVMLAAFIAFKAALAAVWVLMPLVVPEAVAQGFGLIMPPNLASCLGAVLLTDIVAVSWDYWKLTAGLVAASVKA
jgi:hypothetical protein